MTVLCRGSLGFVVELGEIVRAEGEAYLRARATTPDQRKALRKIGLCRTPALGSVAAQCDECGVEYRLFRSCRARICPLCQGEARARWLKAREEELLAVPYFHVVFTVPAELNEIALYCPEEFYAALLRAAGQTLIEVGWSKLHAQLACLAILHTWGQNLCLHPHVHCVVPGGGFSADRQRWVSLQNPEYLLPIDVLSRRFRTLLCDAVRKAARAGKLSRLPDILSVEQLIAKAAAHEWIVYAKPPFGGAEQVLEYLSQYTHRIAISNSRIESYENHEVTFRWRDYRDDNKVKHSTLDVFEFLRRFVMHVPPTGFVRIRSFGFLGNRNRKRNIARARVLIGHLTTPRFRERLEVLRLCPDCYALRRTDPARVPVRSNDKPVPTDPSPRPPPIEVQAA